MIMFGKATIVNPVLKQKRRAVVFTSSIFSFDYGRYFVRSTNNHATVKRLARRYGGNFVADILNFFDVVIVADTLIIFYPDLIKKKMLVSLVKRILGRYFPQEEFLNVGDATPLLIGKMTANII